jgi:hypothetical protein
MLYSKNMKYFISLFNFCFNHLNEIIKQIFIIIFEITSHETGLNLIEKKESTSA